MLGAKSGRWYDYLKSRTTTTKDYNIADANSVFVDRLLEASAWYLLFLKKHSNVWVHSMDNWLTAFNMWLDSIQGHTGNEKKNERRVMMMV